LISTKEIGACIFVIWTFTSSCCCVSLLAYTEFCGKWFTHSNLLCQQSLSLFGHILHVCVYVSYIQNTYKAYILYVHISGDFQVSLSYFHTWVQSTLTIFTLPLTLVYAPQLDLFYLPMLHLFKGILIIQWGFAMAILHMHILYFNQINLLYYYPMSSAPLLVNCFWYISF
jgi:hypothetical protein